jgi:hypothetical protein
VFGARSSGPRAARRDQINSERQGPQLTVMVG